MVTPPIPSTAALLEPAAPPWAQRMLLRLLDFFQWEVAIKPIRLWAAPSTALPKPADWTGSIIWVPDKGKVAVSNGTAWVTTDGAAL